MLTLPTGATVTRVYYALPNGLGIVGTAYDTVLEANLEALRKWGSVQTNCAVNPPRVDQRVVFEFPDGGGLDAVVASHIVYESLTTPAPTSHQQRAALADTAMQQLIKNNVMAEAALSGHA